MDPTGLVLATGLMGLAAIPHCAAMCAAPCAAVTRGCGPQASVQPAFQLGRVAGYALAGAVAASAMGALQQWSEFAPVVRPLWTLVQLAALALGLWMLLTGRLPIVRLNGARAASPPVPQGWQRLHGPARSAGFGLAWVAWPCALTQAALMTAALADRAWGGAMAMAAFALASSPGLLVGPVLLRRLAGPRGETLAAGTWPLRLAGFALVAASGWALGHGLWQRVGAWCAT